MKKSKRFSLLKNLIQEKSYNMVEAIKLLKNFENSNFDESVEAHIALNINSKKTDQHVRSSLILPYGTGKIFKIAVLANLEDIVDIKNFGADYVGNDDLIENILGGNIFFDILITTPSLISKLSKVAKILGPKGLMPSLKAGTLTTNIEKTIKEFRDGKIEYKSDKTGVIHLVIGKISFPEEKLLKNLQFFSTTLQKSKPLTIKGKYIKSFFICTTMSPSIKVNLF